MLNVGVKVFSQFAYYAVMARLLSKAELGIFALLNSFMNFGNMMGDGGMGDAFIQSKTIEKQHVNAAFYSSIGLAVIIYGSRIFYFSMGRRFLQRARAVHLHCGFSVLFFYLLLCILLLLQELQGNSLLKRYLLQMV